MRLICQLVVAVLLASQAVPVRASFDTPVKVESGLLSGVAGVNRDVTVFKGVPYAAPPVGDMRWRAPAPSTKWEGVRRADQFSPICAPNDGRWFPPNNGARAPNTVSEDCLYLNVYTAAKSQAESRPVIVFVHGGGLGFGAGSDYNAEELARKGAVVVTLNYRLGVFGFLAHPDLTKESNHHSSGNYGFLDQIAALRWVQSNIKAFGGDPTRMTLAGQSAGAWSVNYLMASPLSRGLYQRVIGESGGQFVPSRTLADAEQAGMKFLKAAGTDSLAALRQMPMAQLQKIRITGVPGRAWDANVDGWFLPDTVAAIFAQGKQNDVPILVGSNAGEATSPRIPDTTADSLREEAQKNFGRDAAIFLKLYPFDSDETARIAGLDFHRDEVFGWPTREWAQAQTKTGKSKVFLYHFQHVAPGPYAEAGLASPHGGELAFVFNWVNSQANAGTEWRDIDRKLAETVSGYWLNFATTGDPNGPGLVPWPAYAPSRDTVMLFDDHSHVGALPHKDKLDFLSPYLRKPNGLP